jgi:S-adenosylmethionine:tRNA ribosyltransferase-isomerase
VRKLTNTAPIRIGEYDYPLPDERIAKYPLEERDASKLLIYKNHRIEENTFRNAVDYLPENCLLVYNNTRVIQARMVFHKETGARIEVFCLEPAEPVDYALSLGALGYCSWKCMIGNLKKWKEDSLTRIIETGSRSVTLTATRIKVAPSSGNELYAVSAETSGNPTTPPSGNELYAVSAETSGNLTTLSAGNEPQAGSVKASNLSTHFIRFEWDDPGLCFADILELSGELPIPPYLNRPTEEKDHTTYQTVYSKIKGSVAAPTAGLHFTEAVLNDLKRKNIATEELTLHVGAGTFQPVKADDIADHQMHTEVISVKKTTLQNLLKHQGNIIAVGTTSVRTLESLYYLGVQLHQQKSERSAPVALEVGQWEPYETTATLSNDEALQAIIDYLDEHHLSGLQAQTQIMIRPGFEFKLIRGMFTNFHQPKSTLLLLVSAFVGDDWKKIYQYALNQGFRFLSYGDSSLLLP